MQPYVNLDKRLIGTKTIEHKFDKKIRRAEGKESEAQKKARLYKQEKEKQDEGSSN